MRLWITSTVRLRGHVCACFHGVRIVEGLVGVNFRSASIFPSRQFAGLAERVLGSLCLVLCLRVARRAVRLKGIFGQFSLSCLSGARISPTLGTWPSPFLDRCSPRLRSDDTVAEGGFKLPQILANQMQISVEALRVFHPVFTDFLNKRIFHGSSPRKESGDTISGHS
jgi:hypothetical protein